MEYNFCVFIGRFQPLHNSHLIVIKQALKEAKELILVIGSADSARSVKNPWTFQERSEMIFEALTMEEKERVHMVPVRDYFYSDSMWITEVQQRVNAITRGDQSVCMIGTYKDSSSYYVKLFPQWDFIPAANHDILNATDVRHAMFTGDKFTENFVNKIPPEVHGYIFDHFLGEPAHEELQKEYEYIQNYKKTWANTPFPVTFNTVDTVLIQSGHILVVKRKFNPGKGLIALPGGFIKPTETLQQAAIRELKEETGVKVDKVVLANNIVSSHTFDHPGRSLRGRTITHAFCVKLPNGELPEVRGSDDAEQAFWMPLMDIGRNEDQFYEDHFHIIQYFVSKF